MNQLRANSAIRELLDFDRPVEVMVSTGEMERLCIGFAWTKGINQDSYS